MGLSCFLRSTKPLSDFPGHSSSGSKRSQPYRDGVPVLQSADDGGNCGRRGTLTH